MGEEKSFKASKKKQEKARQEGRVGKSSLLTQGVSAGAGIIAFSLAIACIWVRNERVLNYCLAEGFEQPVFCFKAAAQCTLIVLLCGLAVAALAAIAAEAFQVGLRVDPALVLPKAERFNLAQGLKRIGSGLTDLWIDVLKFCLLATVLGWFFKDLMRVLPQCALLSAAAQVRTLRIELTVLLARALGGLLILGLADYALKRRRLDKELSMSAYELRRETKEEEGDPFIRAQRRSLHESIVMQDLVASVRKARVIVVEKN
jgi:flagellar biosynthesis protein FlhB